MLLEMLHALEHFDIGRLEHNGPGTPGCWPERWPGPR